MSAPKRAQRRHPRSPSRLERRTAAIPKFEEAVEKLSRFLGPDHPDVGTTVITLSNSYLRVGRLDQAERLARQGLKIRMAKFEASSVPVAGGRLRLGEILVARKKYAEADGLLRQAAEVLMKETGPSGPNTQLAIKTRIELYQKLGRTADARAQEALLAEKPAQK